MKASCSAVTIDVFCVKWGYCNCLNFVWACSYTHLVLDDRCINSTLRWQKSDKISWVVWILMLSMQSSPFLKYHFVDINAPLPFELDMSNVFMLVILTRSSAVLRLYFQLYVTFVHFCNYSTLIPYALMTPCSPASNQLVTCTCCACDAQVGLLLKSLFDCFAQRWWRHGSQKVCSFCWALLALCTFASFQGWIKLRIIFASIPPCFFFSLNFVLWLRVPLEIYRYFFCDLTHHSF